MKLPEVEPDRIPRLRPAFLARILAFYRPYLWRVTGASLVIVLGVGFTLLQPLILRDLIDQAAAGTDFLRMSRVAAALVLLPILAAALSVLQQRIIGAIAADAQFDLRNKVYTHLQYLPYRMYVHAPPGEITARLSGDVQQTSQIIAQTLPEGGANSLKLLFSLVIMFLLEWRLSLAALLALPLAGWVMHKRNYQARKFSLNSMQASAAMGLHVGETTNPSGIMNLRLFNRVRLEVERYRELSNNVRLLEKKQNTLHANTILAGSLTTAIGTALVYAAGGLLVFSGDFSIGTLIALVAYLGGLYTSAQGLLRLPQNIAQALVSYERIFELLDLPQEPQGETPASLPPRAQGELVFQDVTFQFDDSVPLRETSRPWSLNLMGKSGSVASPVTGNALEEITFAVHPGRMVAIVGPSGAGKSTIFNLIPRFYDPIQGEIRLDGRRLQDIPVQWLREQISFVGQGIYISPGTLRDNLLYAQSNATDSQLWDALASANLLEWAKTLPHGLDTFLGQSGSRLSGGERQRLAIARALLKDSPLLMLDEATSHLDSINESLLQDALFRVRQNRSTLVIAHRLSTVHHADEILVLEHGKIVERGNHSGLLNQNGLYARLYEKQFIYGKKEENP